VHFTSSSLYDTENVAARLFEVSPYFLAIAKTSPFRNIIFGCAKSRPVFAVTSYRSCKGHVSGSIEGKRSITND
jgi:hypothetical protein